MVQALHFGVVPQQVQALAVGLPQELHPGSEQQAISTILSVLSTHSTQENTEVKTSSMFIIHLKIIMSSSHANYLIPSAVTAIYCITHNHPTTIRHQFRFCFKLKRKSNDKYWDTCYAAKKHLSILTFQESGCCPDPRCPGPSAGIHPWLSQSSPQPASGKPLPHPPEIWYSPKSKERSYTLTPKKNNWWKQLPDLCKHHRFLLTHLLADVLVLVKTLLGQVALAKIHAELQVLEHDGLVDLLPCSMFLALDDIVQNIQSWLLLANLKKLCVNTSRNRPT